MYLLTQQEAADETRLSGRTLERHRLAGTGPKFVRLGRRVLYRREDVEAWVASNICRSNLEADAMAGRCGDPELANSGDLVGNVEESSAGILRQHQMGDHPPGTPLDQIEAGLDSECYQRRNKIRKKSSAHRDAEGAA
jgi:predicted DNA-binding transcriptional regulator AlpA